MEERVAKYSLGAAVTQGDVHAMTRLLETDFFCQLRQSAKFVNGCQAYAQQHGLSRLTTAMQELLTHCTRRVGPFS